MPWVGDAACASQYLRMRGGLHAFFDGKSWGTSAMQVRSSTPARPNARYPRSAIYSTARRTLVLSAIGNPSVHRRLGVSRSLGATLRMADRDSRAHGLRRQLMEMLLVVR